MKNIIRSKPKENEWIDGNSKLKFNINSLELDLLNEEEYLFVDESKTSIKLSDLGYDRNYKIVNYIKTPSRLRILLSFDYMSKYYVWGRCGGANETGYILLNYDNSMNLMDMKRVLLGSCMEDIYYEEYNKENSNSGKKYFKHNEEYDIENRDDLPENVIIDKEKVDIKTEN